MHLFEDFKVRDGLSVHLWPTRKFRTSYLQIYLHCPLNDETATFFNLLPAVLTRGTREHPETIDLNKRLDMLYGASLSSTFSRRGERGLVAFTANMPDIRCEGREPLEHLAKLAGLRTLSLGGTKVTVDGVERLRRAPPARAWQSLPSAARST